MNVPMNRVALRRRGGIAALCLIGSGTAFALGRATAVEGTPAAQIVSVSSLLSKSPMGREDAFRILPAAQGQDASVAVVEARKELRLHYHEDRDEVAYIVRGGGTMTLGEEKRPVKAGDIIYLPRHVVHGFTNGSKGDTVVLSVMSPPFDGKDRHFLDEPSTPK